MSWGILFGGIGFGGGEEEERKPRLARETLQWPHQT